MMLCPTGKKVVGGGAKLHDIYCWVKDSSPVADNNQWQIELSDGRDVSLDYYIICVDAL